MDYLKAYYNLINKAKSVERNCYLELHHVVPRCVYRENLLDERNLTSVNQNSNLVFLTAREHFVSHWLLHRAFPKNKKLGLAFWAMAGMKSPSQKRHYIPSSRAIAEARIAANNSRKIPILQYGLDGKFVQEFKSLNAASKSVGVVPNAIGQNLNSLTKSAGGYQWRFKTNEFPKKIEEYIIENNGLPIGQYDLKGNLIQYFDSLLDTERITGHSEGSIRAAMNRGSKIKGTPYFFIQFIKKQEIPKFIESYKIPVHGFSIPVVQISADEKYFIKKFKSVTHAANFLKKNPGHISSVCKGKRKTAYGFIWKYLSNYKNELPVISLDEAKRKLHSKPIAQFDLNGKYLKTFKSSSEAARSVKDAQGNISAVANGKRKYSNNYQYAYIENNEIPRKLPIKKSANISKCVLQLHSNTNEIIAEHKSIGLAASAVSGSQSNISACINGRKKTAYGYKWILK